MLYTVIVNFEDGTFAMNQYEANLPIDALTRFVEEAESLEDYNRNKNSIFPESLFHFFSSLSYF